MPRLIIKRLVQKNVAALSFNGNKIITTGGGGMILTHSHRTADRVRLYASQCKVAGNHFFMMTLVLITGCQT